MSRRQRARRMREAAHYAARRAAAPDAAARAVVAFDRLRALLADVPPDGREVAWSAVADYLDGFAAQFETDHAASPRL